MYSEKSKSEDGDEKMNILVINGSPKAEQSDSMKLTKAFLVGMNEHNYEIIDTMKQPVKPCIGCYSCWNKTPGQCIQKDGMNIVLDKIKDADIVIWSFPLYCYGMPSNLKAYIDRLLPLTTKVQDVDENGETYHPAREEHKVRNIMISGCGFPNKSGNYEGAIFTFQKLFGETEIITCVEAPMLSIEEAKPLAEKYLKVVEQAGREYAKTGGITEETHRILDTPMYDPKAYRKMCSNN